MSPQSRRFARGIGSMALGAAIAATPAWPGPHVLSIGATVLPAGDCTYSARASTISFGAAGPFSAADSAVHVPVRCNGGAAQAISWPGDDAQYRSAQDPTQLRSSTYTASAARYSLSRPSSEASVVVTVEP